MAFCEDTGKAVVVLWSHNQDSIGGIDTPLELLGYHRIGLGLHVSV
jgi:hypothetical protein